MVQSLQTGCRVEVLDISERKLSCERRSTSRPSAATNGKAHPSEVNSLLDSQAEIAQVAEQLGARLQEAWQNAGVAEIAAISFGFDLEARLAFWQKVQESVQCWCVRKARGVLRTSPTHSGQFVRDAAISRAEQCLVTALVDAALVEILNHGSPGQMCYARDLLIERYESRILEMAKKFERMEDWKGVTAEELRSSAYVHLFLDKAQDALDAEVRRKGQARIRRYALSFEGKNGTGRHPRGFATLATFVDKVLRNYFIQETRAPQRYSSSKKTGKDKCPPKPLQSGVAESNEYLVEKVLDRIMLHPKMGVRECSNLLRPLLQNQPSLSLRQAIVDDGQLYNLMNRLPGNRRAFVSLAKHNSCKSGDDDKNALSNSECQAAVSQYEQRQHKQQSAEYREVLGQILVRLRNEEDSTHKHGKAPFSKVDVFEKYWLGEMKLREIVALVKRSIGCVQGAIKRVENRCRQIILRDHPEMALFFDVRPSGEQSLSC